MRTSITATRSVRQTASRARRDAAPLPCTGARLRRLTRRVTAFYEQHLRACGLRLSQYSVLTNLSVTPRPLTQLADLLEMDRTTLSRSVRPLIDQGWVEDTAGDDARQRLLALTASGVRCRAEAQKSWRSAQLALEQRLDRAFVGALNAQLEQALSRLKSVLPRDN
ncbi:MAG TPA: MarR family winged helix-turn-helix transcriptional regulator [Burkholderiales bacterium]|nr:MarR family winged helix-turn-helix transcriptional regulator [Burkholderiales bacterium]